MAAAAKQGRSNKQRHGAGPGFSLAVDGRVRGRVLTGCVLLALPLVFFATSREWSTDLPTILVDTWKPRPAARSMKLVTLASSTPTTAPISSRSDEISDISETAAAVAIPATTLAASTTTTTLVAVTTTTSSTVSSTVVAIPATTLTASTTTTTFIRDVLFAVFTDSLFFSTRVGYILETWGSMLAPQSLMFVGDKSAQVMGHSILPSRCEAHTHAGACCKVASAVYDAYERVKSEGQKWVYFTDDDAYVVVNNMLKSLRSHESDSHRNIILGVFGCVVREVCHGLCGGGGFAMSRKALFDIVGHPTPVTRKNFLNEASEICVKCDMWGDQAISMFALKRHAQFERWPGLQGWIMKRPQFDEEIGKYPPLMFHYMRYKGQFQFLHRLYGPGPEDSCPGERGRGPCVRWGARKCCTQSSQQADVPWDTSRRLSALTGRRALAVAEFGSIGCGVAGDVPRSLKQETICAAKKAGLSGPWPLEALAERYQLRRSDQDYTPLAGVLE